MKEACDEPMEGRHREKGNCGDNRPRSPTKRIGFPPNSIRFRAEIERRVIQAQFPAHGVNIGTLSVMIKSAAMERFYADLNPHLARLLASAEIPAQMRENLLLN
jgi:hypothetical protein